MLKRQAILCLVLALALVFSACTVAPTATVTPGPTIATTPTPIPVVTLRMLNMNANYSGLIDKWYSKIYLDELHVYIDMIPSGDQATTVLAAMMASGELPDLVQFQEKTQVSDAVKAGLLLNLDDNIAMLPNAVKNAPVALRFNRDKASGDTGKLYSITTQVGPQNPTTLPSGDDPNWGPYMRWDLYKQLGMPKISTLEDYLPVLKSMMDLYPTTPDGQKVYGISLWADWDSTSMYLATEASCTQGIDTGDQFGTTLPFAQVDFNDNSVGSILDSSSWYVRNLHFYFAANQMGLVDPDSLTQKFDAAYAKSAEGRVLFGWWSWFPGNYDTTDRVNADKPSGYRPVPMDTNKVMWFTASQVGMSYSWSIGAKTKYPDYCLRFIDWHYDPSNMTKLVDGPKGVIWDIGTDGKPYITDTGWTYVSPSTMELPGGGTLSEGERGLKSGGVGGDFIDPTFGLPYGFTFWPSSRGRNPSKLLKDWQTTTGYSSTMTMLEDKKMLTVVPLARYLVPAVPDDIKAIVAQIGDIVKTNSWKMCFAKDQAEYDSLLKEMQDSAKSLGIDQVIAWDKTAWQSALDSQAAYSGK